MCDMKNSSCAAHRHQPKLVRASGDDCLQAVTQASLHHRGNVGARPSFCECASYRQNKKSPQCVSQNRSAYSPLADESTPVANNGERIAVEFPPNRIDSSDLTVRMHTPDGQHSALIIHLQTLRK
jgi:hypothetical protein